MAKGRDVTRPLLSPVFGSFFPLQVLWDESAPNPLFKSECSARWFLRQHRPALVQEKAIAVHAGRMLVNPQVCAKVAEKVALDVAEATAKDWGDRLAKVK